MVKKTLKEIMDSWLEDSRVMQESAEADLKRAKNNKCSSREMGWIKERDTYYAAQLQTVEFIIDELKENDLL